MACGSCLNSGTVCGSGSCSGEHPPPSFAAVITRNRASNPFARTPRAQMVMVPVARARGAGANPTDGTDTTIQDGLDSSGNSQSAAGYMKPGTSLNSSSTSGGVNWNAVNSLLATTGTITTQIINAAKNSGPATQQSVSGLSVTPTAATPAIAPLGVSLGWWGLGAVVLGGGIGLAIWAGRK